MKFFSKKKKPVQVADKKLHNIFRGASVVVVGCVLYSMFAGGQGQDNLLGRADMSDEQVQQQVEAAVKRMSDTPEYKAIKDFSDYVNSVEDKDSTKVLAANKGILVYIPQKLLDGEGDISASGEGVELKISPKKTPENKK